MKESYYSNSLIFSYLKWHYTKGLKDFFSVSSNFFWFITHFFSFKLLLKTLFSPWKRLKENYTNFFDFNSFFSAFIVNSIMRAVGLVTRIFVIGIGLSAYIFVFLISISIFIIWIFAPLVTAGSLILAITFFVI